MTFDQLLDYMYEHHRIRRQKDIANYFGVTTQAISNWKRTDKEYLARMSPSGLTEATHDGYWTFKHKNGKIFKIHGTSWIDYTEKTFKCAFSTVK